MKSCPKCNTDYFDNMLEFCLEDGTKLIFINSSVPPAAVYEKPDSKIAETVQLPFSGVPETLDLRNSTQNQISPATTPQTVSLRHRATQKGFKILEIAPIVFSLAHNWWQWLYLDFQNFASLSAFLISPFFLIWLILLLAGTSIGLFSLKFCENKGFAYTSLIIFAINFLLFLVPKR